MSIFQMFIWRRLSAITSSWSHSLSLGGRLHRYNSSLNHLGIANTPEAQYLCPARIPDHDRPDSCHPCDRPLLRVHLTIPLQWEGNNLATGVSISDQKSTRRKAIDCPSSQQDGN